MADIELVIKIPEEIYERFGYEYREENLISKHTNEIILDAFCNGIPLLKGHGRLKDAGQCDRKLFYQQCGGADSLITVESAFDMLMSLPTIIEADKAEGEDDDEI